MVFSSVVFLFYFFPLFFLFYYLVPRNFKNYVILIFSVFFYAWGAPKFIFLVLFSMILNYFLVRGIEKANSKKERKIYLILSLFINVGLLVYFKYFNFFIENINEFLALTGFENITWTSIALPIGISFFTFQSITYSVDVYRGIHKPLKKLSDYLVYILMFPQLIAGPIIRYNTIADQIENRAKNEILVNRISGFQRFCIGLAKKVLIANIMAETVDKVYALSPEQLSFFDSWLVALGYTIQIYFDFSGYSDMAIGIGKMIGFKFPENFNNPYVSGSISEFWRRWHITLGEWMKEYLYIPLGGNRVSQMRLYLNLWVVFLLSGLWHGASWNFVLWGAWHGLFLIFDRMFLLKFYKVIGRSLSVIITFLIVVIGWVFFRIENINDAFGFLLNMFSVKQKGLSLLFDKEFFLILGLGLCFSFFTIMGIGARIEKYVFFSNNESKKSLIYKSIVAVILFLLSVSFIVSGGFNPFIYFRF